MCIVDARGTAQAGLGLGQDAALCLSRSPETGKVHLLPSSLHSPGCQVVGELGREVPVGSLPC